MPNNTDSGSAYPSCIAKSIGSREIVSPHRDERLTGVRIEELSDGTLQLSCDVWEAESILPAMAALGEELEILLQKPSLEQDVHIDLGETDITGYPSLIEQLSRLALGLEENGFRLCINAGPDTFDVLRVHENVKRMHSSAEMAGTTPDTPRISLNPMYAFGR